MLHLKQLSSPFSLFVLCVFFFVLEVSFLVHLSQQYLKVVYRLVFQKLRAFTSWNSSERLFSLQSMIIEKKEFELLKSELVFRIWVSENYHTFKTLTNLNVSNCAHKWPKIEQKIFQVPVKCFSLLDDSSLQLIDIRKTVKSYLIGRNLSCSWLETRFRISRPLLFAIFVSFLSSLLQNLSELFHR